MLSNECKFFERLILIESQTWSIYVYPAQNEHRGYLVWFKIPNLFYKVLSKEHLWDFLKERKVIKNHFFDNYFSENYFLGDLLDPVDYFYASDGSIEMGTLREPADHLKWNAFRDSDYSSQTKS